jgi:hypothetical protein
MRVATFNILRGRTVGDGVHPQQLNARSVNNPIKMQGVTRAVHRGDRRVDAGRALCRPVRASRE